MFHIDSVMFLDNPRAMQKPMTTLLTTYETHNLPIIIDGTLHMAYTLRQNAHNGKKVVPWGPCNGDYPSHLSNS